MAMRSAEETLTRQARVLTANTWMELTMTSKILKQSIAVQSWKGDTAIHAGEHYGLRRVISMMHGIRYTASNTGSTTSRQYPNRSRCSVPLSPPQRQAVVAYPGYCSPVLRCHQLSEHQAGSWR